MSKFNQIAVASLLVSLFSLFLFLSATAKQEMGMNQTVPAKNDVPTTKLMFIHHSVGGHWLAHDYGGLVAELNRNGFYVNDITYGWLPPEIADSWSAQMNSRVRDLFGSTPIGADRIGDRTDIGHFYDWFVGPDSGLIMDAVYKENAETDQFGEHGNGTSPTPVTNPGLDVENEIIMIKPCYPNSLYKGNGDDSATTGDEPSRNFEAGSDEHTVANSKRIYNDILTYFTSRPDKFFVIITAPPRRELPEEGQVARDFSNWLVHDWLNENNYSIGNVMVFDLYNVLTSGPSWEKNDLGVDSGNHHHMVDGVEHHQVEENHNVLTYPRDGNNNHPSPAGLQKATGEFFELLNSHYSRWVQKKAI